MQTLKFYFNFCEGIIIITTQDRTFKWIYATSVMLALIFVFRIKPISIQKWGMEAILTEYFCCSYHLLQVSSRISFIAVLMLWMAIFFTCFHHQREKLQYQVPVDNKQIRGGLMNKVIRKSTSSLSTFALWSSGSRRTSSANWIHSLTFSGDTNSNTTCTQHCRSRNKNSL